MGWGALELTIQGQPIPYAFLKGLSIDYEIDLKIM